MVLTIRLGPATGLSGDYPDETHARWSGPASRTHHPFEFKLDLVTIESDAARLRAAAEAKPMKLPVNRRVDESHHLVTEDGLSVWYTIQVSPHSRIQEAIFERSDRMPSDDECMRWLQLLVVGAEAVEAPGLPAAMTRRFEAFERNPEREAPLA